MREISEDEIRILKEGEREVENYFYIPLNLISIRLGFSMERTLSLCRSLSRKKLIRLARSPVYGFAITPKGFDVLALKLLADRDVVYALGRKLGVGKESNVFEGKTAGGKIIAVKISRMGKRSFLKVRRYRNIEEDVGRYWWYTSSVWAAKREWKALNILSRVESRVPRPVDREKHVLVTEKIDGAMLTNAYWAVSDPELLIRELLQEVKLWVREAGMTHGDLSPYNVLIRDTDFIIIDWPQWVNVTHPMFRAYLRRDVLKLLEFFKRKFGVKIDLDTAMRFIAQ